MIGLALTKEQFKTLLNMAYIANWVANGRRLDDEYLEEYEELEEYIFSRAKEAGFPDAAYKHKTDERGEHFHPSRAFEFDREIERLIAEYDEETFFDELAERFAGRDLEQLFGKDAKKKLSPTRSRGCSACRNTARFSTAWASTTSAWRSF
jgi:hypothetical protein